MVSVTDSYDHIISIVENALKDGVILPSVVFILCEPQHIIIPAMYANDREKKIFHKYAGKLAEAKGALGVVFVSDAWVKSFEKDKESVDLTTPVRDQAGRKEAVIVTLISPMKRHLTTFTYKKDGDKVISYQKNKEFDSGSGMLFDSYFKINA